MWITENRSSPNKISRVPVDVMHDWMCDSEPSDGRVAAVSSMSGSETSVLWNNRENTK